uniref:Phosducin-like n=1 Tax=Mus musculus TaxID=10090 RepID=A0A0N4SWE2_MOUSE
MTTLDDKLLGEKLQYYYSTSEDEDSDHEDKDRGRGAPAISSTPAEAELAGEGISINTVLGIKSWTL